MPGQARTGGSDLWYAPVYSIQYLVDSVLQRQIIGEFSQLQLEAWGGRPNLVWASVSQGESRAL